ncbi:zinc ribbon domain-containing protein [Roseburia sp. 499]|uniref:zinc ribbon domain-containing protein n=1 Tax=Roseburia sp. 499 TaxID=1261634 RepID=UPI0009514F12|nr:zinc ribbon domain-containing protein [Roseburia sp. 499]WVK69647.1 zinc ribbon domain-containing protein [Roseburia sp. 499]
MDFFSKLGDTISATGKDVSKKARDLTGLAKLNMDLRAKEEYILRQYQEIGKQYYEQHKEDTESAFGEIALIKEAMEEMEAIKGEIAELKGMKRCQSCGTPLNIDDVFCKKCGAKYEEPETEVYEGEVE